MSPAERKMDDCESLPEVKRKDAASGLKREMEDHSWVCKESSTKRPKESLIEEESSTNSYSDPLLISETTKHSKVAVEKDTLKQHLVYIHIYYKEDKAAFHLDHVMQGLGE